jgi:hypothetical protein
MQRSTTTTHLDSHPPQATSPKSSGKLLLRLAVPSRTAQTARSSLAMEAQISLFVSSLRSWFAELTR